MYFRKALEKCKHPNCRKTKQLGKQLNRQKNKHNARLAHAAQSKIIGEKLNWFLEHIDENRREPLSVQEFAGLIESYLKRFDDELEQIAMKQSISRSRSQQHVNRQTIIRLTIERETAEYNGGGIEMLNLCDAAQFESLRCWDGNSMSIQHFKLHHISRNRLNRLICSEYEEEMSCQAQPREMEVGSII